MMMMMQPQEYSAYGHEKEEEGGEMEQRKEVVGEEELEFESQKFQEWLANHPLTHKNSNLSR